MLFFKIVKQFGCLIKSLYKGNRIVIKYQNYILKNPQTGIKIRGVKLSLPN